MKRWYALGISMLLVGGLATPSLVEARGGAGSRSWGGRSYHFQNNDFRRGCQGNHPMYGEGTRSNWGDDNRVNGNFDNDRFNRNVNVNVNNNFYNPDYNG